MGTHWVVFGLHAPLWTLGHIVCRLHSRRERAPPEYLFLPGIKDLQRGAMPIVETDTTVYFFDCASLFRSNSHALPEGGARQYRPSWGQSRLR